MHSLFGDIVIVKKGIGQEVTISIMVFIMMHANR